MQGREIARNCVRAALSICFLLAASSSAWAHVLIFGDRLDARNQLATRLTNLGENITNVSALPVDLSAYQVIWHVSAFTALTGAERDRLFEFVDSGRGLQLSGERICPACETMNTSLETLINSLVAGGGVEVGNQGDPLGGFNFNPNALQSVVAMPNVLSVWNASLPGAMAGTIKPENILATSQLGQIVGAAWDESDMTGERGRLGILMDSTWVAEVGNTSAIANLQTFLSVPEPAALGLFSCALLLLRHRRNR